MALTVRRAVATDIAVLVPLINRAYRVEDFFVVGDRTDPEDLAARLATPGASILIAEDQHHVAGSIFVQVKGDRGFFGMLSVDPDRQQQGVGRTLVRAAEDHCRAAGCRFLDLDVVNVRPELPVIYGRLGFAPFGTEPFHRPEILRRPVHLILMTKALVDLWKQVVVVVAIAWLSAACSRPAPEPPAATNAPAAEAPPAPGATWDPWQEAASRGIDFRAVGNEPGWYLEVDYERWMRIFYAYGERQVTVPAVKPVEKDGVTTFVSSAGGHTVRADVTPGPCSDGMSDQTYPLNVAVDVDGMAMRGCGRWLR